MLTQKIQTDELEIAGVRSPLIQAGPPDADEAVVFIACSNFTFNNNFINNC